MRPVRDSVSTQTITPLPLPPTRWLWRWVCNCISGGRSRWCESRAGSHVWSASTYVVSRSRWQCRALFSDMEEFPRQQFSLVNSFWKVAATLPLPSCLLWVKVYTVQRLEASKSYFWLGKVLPEGPFRYDRTFSCCNAIVGGITWRNRIIIIIEHNMPAMLKMAKNPQTNKNVDFLMMLFCRKCIQTYIYTYCLQYRCCGCLHSAFHIFMSHIIVYSYFIL